MFYSMDASCKSTVVCIHPRYFVSFRHGTHLQLKIGDLLTIFHAKNEDCEQKEHRVSVVYINENLDFILLKSKKTIVTVYLSKAFIFTDKFF